MHCICGNLTKKEYFVKTALKFLSILFCLVFLCSCTDKKVEIVKNHENSAIASETCGIAEVNFVPSGFLPERYSSLYGIVYECEYRNEGAYSVLRIVPAEYTTTNLSGFADTLLYEVYKIGDTEYEIESREGIFACEFRTDFFGTECDVAYTLSGGTDDLFREQLRELVTYLSGDKNE